MKKALVIAAQAGVLVGIWFFSDSLVRLLGLPVPAGVVGLLLLLALLLSGKVAPRWVKSGADWMLSEMLLFFVPSAVAIIQYGRLFESEGLRLALVVIPGTLLVMCVTAIAVEFGVRVERGITLRRLRRSRPARAARIALHAASASGVDAAARAGSARSAHVS